MADGDIVIVRQATVAAPKDYELSGTQELSPLAVRAAIDGSGAAGAFLPALQLLGPSGEVVWTAISSTSVAAGASADVSWFPRVKPPAAPVSTFTYAQIVQALAVSTSLIAEWHLSDGASPYADTSGFLPADPATMVRQARVVPMTQSYSPGPLAGAQQAPGVAFNFDGDATVSTGDSLGDTSATHTRYQFLNTDPFTIIAWVLPFVGAATHDGPVVNTITVTGFGTPGANDNGWRLNVTYPGLVPQFQRAALVLAAGSYDTAAGSALSTSAWSMLAGSYDGATLRLYVNGALAASAASAGNITSTASAATIGEGPHSLGDYGTWYYGGASQITVWGGALSAIEIAQLYTAGTT